MTQISSKSDVPFLDTFSGDPSSTSAAVTNRSDSRAAPKTHQHSKQSVDQNESSNDASNETSDSDSGSSTKPLTSRNLEAKNNIDTNSVLGRQAPTSTAQTSPPTGDDGKNGHVIATASSSVSGASSVSAASSAASGGVMSKSALPKKFFCKVCNQGFTRKHNMVSHEMIHTTIKVHRCTSCNLSFRRIHDLKRHEKLHTGEKPFHCEHCDRRFARPDALTRHLNSPHACAGLREQPEGAADAVNAESQKTSAAPKDGSNQASTQTPVIKSTTAWKHKDEADLTQTFPKKIKRGSIPPNGNEFNAEQSLPLGSTSSSVSILPTSKPASSSDQDSGITSSEKDPRRPMAISNLSGESNDSTVNSRKNVEIDKWRSQQLPASSSYASKTDSANYTGQNSASTILSSATRHNVKDLYGNVPGKQFANNPDTASQASYPAEQYSYHPYPQFHAPNSSMEPSFYSPSEFPSQQRLPMSAMASQPSPRPGLPHNLSQELRIGHADSDGAFSQDNNEKITGTKKPPNFPSNQDSSLSSSSTHGQQLPQYLPNYNSMHSGAYSGQHMAQNVHGRQYTTVANQEGWQDQRFQQSQQQPRSSADGRPSMPDTPTWPLINSEKRDEKTFPPVMPQYVRWEQHLELYSHNDVLQQRIAKLESRMEMLEEKIRRDKKTSMKLHKRNEKRVRKANKKSQRPDATSATN